MLYFFVYKKFDIFIKPWRISIITYYCFVQYKIAKYIQNCFIKSIYFFASIFIGKYFFLIKSINHSYDKFNICILVMPDLSIILWHNAIKLYKSLWIQINVIKLSQMALSYTTANWVELTWWISWSQHTNLIEDQSFDLISICFLICSMLLLSILL